MIKKNYLFTLLTLPALLCFGTPNAWGEELTVANGDATNTGVPICGNYADTKGMRSQFIYPSSLLTDMEYGTISKVKFYSSTASKAFTSTFEVRLSEVSASTLSGFNTDGGTKVYTGSLTLADNEMEISFDTPYEYNGDGNLLFDIEVTANTSAWVNAAFYGITQSGAGYSNKVYYGGAQVCNLLPKATFTYTPGAPPTCPKPKNFAMTDMKANTASFSWAKGGDETQWQYICLPAATAVDWSSPSVQTTTSTSATIINLTAETAYKFYLRAYCDVDDQSAEISHSFSTPCVGESLPWDCGFETSEGYTAGSTASAAPACWNMLNANSGSYPYIYIANKSGYRNGTLGLYFESSKSKYGYIILPPFTAPTNLLKVNFVYKTESTSTSCGQITIGYITDINDETTFVPVEECTRNTSLTTKSDILFTAAPSYARIAFRYGGGTADNWYAGIDDIHVESTQNCGKPETPTYEDLTGSSVTINWTANSGVTDYKYINVDRTANPDYVLNWESDATPVTGTSVALSELVDGHNYEFYVMCACGTVASDACTYQPLSCPNVTEVSLSNQLWNGVTINWTTSATTNCDVQYKAGSGEWQTAETNTSATSKVISGLSVGTEYSFRVKPNCSADGWISSASTYTPACPALGALSLSGQTYNGVTVSWSAVAGISSWNLRYRKGSDSWTEVNNIAALTYTIASGLVTNEEYTIELYSECGGDAASTTYTPVYEIPAVLTASPVKDVTATLNWSTVDGASGYQYSCVKTGQADAWSATQVANSVALSGLEAAEEYTAKVRAVFGGSNYSDPKEKVFSTVCQAPISLVKGETSSSSLAFSWSKSAEGNADNRYQYVCKTGSSTPTADEWSTNGVLLDERVRSVTVEGLNANTTYYFFVRSYYGADKYSTALSGNNKTDCGIEGIGYTENFASGVKPGCWTISNWGTSANYWTTDNSYAKSGYALRYNAKTNSSSDATTSTIHLAEKAILTYYIRNYYTYYSTNYDIPGKIIVTDLTDGSKTAEFNFPTKSTSITTAREVDLSAFVGDDITITFHGQGVGTSYTAYVYIDDISITYKPISAPTLSALVATTDGAIVSWTHDEDGPFDLRYREKDAEPAAEWIEVNTINDKTKTLTGLTVGTEYEVQVRANISAHRISSWTASQTFTPVNCPVPTSLETTEITHNSATISWSGDAKALRYKTGSDDWSNETISPANETFDLSELVAESTYTVQVKADCEEGDTWSDALEFTTKCTPISITKVAPYEADFAGLTNEMPSCWDKSATTMPYVTGEELQFNGKDQTAILPKFSNATSTLMLKFNYKHSYAASYSGQIQVGYIDASGDFQAFGSALSGATPYTAAEISFDGVDDDEAKYIAIRLIHNNPSNISYANGFIKDVVVELAPTCYAPASIADAASITASGATLSWTASGKGETQYQWAVAEGSAAPAWVDDAAHKVTAPTTSVTLTGLNAQTDYTFYVRSYCNADDQSEEVSKAFTTKCAAIAAADMPFEEAFSATLSACWKTYAASYYSIYVSSGELHATAPKTSGSESVVVMPAFEMALNQLVVSFDYKGSNGTVEVGYVTDPEDKTTFVAVGDAYTVASAYKQAVTAFVSLGAVTGNVALRFKGNTGDGSFTVDNLRVAYGTGIADNTDNSEALAGLLGQTVDFVVNRTFKRADYFNTLCLPFSLSEEELANSPFAGAELWTFKYASVVNDELQVRIQQETSIKAGRPYLILFGAGEDLVNPLFKNVTITATSGEHMNYENIAFIGTLAPVAFVADDANRLFLTANNLLAWANTNGNVRSFRAYFEITPSPHPSQIRRGMSARIVKKEEVATGIEDVQGSDVQSTKVLENNQVLIIRNGVKYNLQGQVVK